MLCGSVTSPAADTTNTYAYTKAIETGMANTRLKKTTVVTWQQSFTTNGSVDRQRKHQKTN